MDPLALAAELEEAQEAAERWKRKGVQAEAEVRALRVKIKDLQFSKSGDDARQIALSVETVRAEEAEKFTQKERRLRDNLERENNDSKKTIRSLEEKLRKYESTGRQQQVQVTSVKRRYEEELIHLREQREAAWMHEADQNAVFERLFIERLSEAVERHRKKAQLNNKALLNLREELSREKKALEAKCVDLAVCDEKLQSSEQEVAEERRKHKETQDLNRRVKEQLQKEKDEARWPEGEKGHKARDRMSEYEGLQWEIQCAEETVLRLEEEGQAQKEEDRIEADKLRQENFEIREQQVFHEERNAFLEESLAERGAEERLALLEEERRKLKGVAKQAMDKHRFSQSEVVELRRHLAQEKSLQRRGAAAARRKSNARLTTRGKVKKNQPNGSSDWRHRMDEWLSEAAHMSSSMKTMCKTLKRDVQAREKKGGYLIGPSPSTEVIDRLNAMVDALLDHVASLEYDHRRTSIDSDHGYNTKMWARSPIGSQETDDLASQMDDLVRKHDMECDEYRRTAANLHAQNERLQIALLETSPTIERELSEKLERRDQDFAALSATLEKMRQIHTSLVTEMEGLAERREEDVRMHASVAKERDSAFEFERTCMRKRLHDMERDLRRKNDDLKSMSIVVEAQRFHLEEKECVGVGVDAELASLESRHNTGEWYPQQRKEDVHAVKNVELSRPYGSPSSSRAHSVPPIHAPIEERRTPVSAKARATTGRWPVRLGLITPTLFAQREVNAAKNTSSQDLASQKEHNASRISTLNLQTVPTVNFPAGYMRRAVEKVINGSSPKSVEPSISYAAKDMSLQLCYGARGGMDLTAMSHATLTGIDPPTLNYSKGGRDAMTLSYGKPRRDTMTINYVGKGGDHGTAVGSKGGVDFSAAMRYGNGMAAGAAHEEVRMPNTPLMHSDFREEQMPPTVPVLRPLNYPIEMHPDTSLCQSPITSPEVLLNRSMSSPALKKVEHV
eukprot:GEMP01002040.1.p1 GENE.GEMP01002040.1~~GEMP01002040.1.p1  ORF type:complete len:963 (+),score=243.42 GEMP01002040.1:107-2995(+)